MSHSAAAERQRDSHQGSDESWGLGASAGSRGNAGAAPRAGAMRVGTRVRHPLFGIGVVESVTPRGGSTALRVAVKAVGSKTLIQEFARLQVIG